MVKEKTLSPIELIGDTFYGPGEGFVANGAYRRHFSRMNQKICL